LRVRRRCRRLAHGAGCSAGCGCARRRWLSESGGKILNIGIEVDFGGVGRGLVAQGRHGRSTLAYDRRHRFSEIDLGGHLDIEVQITAAFTLMQLQKKLVGTTVAGIDAQELLEIVASTRLVSALEGGSRHLVNLLHGAGAITAFEQ
jgi:hypothetical protein